MYQRMTFGFKKKQLRIMMQINFFFPFHCMCLCFKTFMTDFPYNRAHFIHEPDLVNEAHLVEQHAALLERQWPIEVVI